MHSPPSGLACAGASLPQLLLPRFRQPSTFRNTHPRGVRREGQGGQRSGAHQRIGAPDICRMAWRKDQSKEKKTEWKFKSMLSNCIHETLSRVR